MKQRLTFLLLILSSCTATPNPFDASGTFEAVETIVSAEATGKILHLDIEEGQQIAENTVVGSIDPISISLQKEEVISRMTALSERTSNPAPQLKLLKDQLMVQQAQLNNLLHEQQRIQNLVIADAATPKQLDDINSQVNVSKKQLAVTTQQMRVTGENIASQNRSVLSEKLPLDKKLGQLEDQQSKTRIINPVNGVVLTKYAQAFEITSPGKPLYKIANMSTLILRAYISGSQFSSLKPDQPVKVYVDSVKGYKNYPGKIEWISDKAEFTPKTIQTKEERANLVYAIKIRVPNDGSLKIGMYANVKFQ
ncbi:MAG: HlyD family efflux transporter periplasmic adaptor subunit [Ginsengibacter sp.]